MDSAEIRHLNTQLNAIVKHFGFGWVVDDSCDPRHNVPGIPPGKVGHRRKPPDFPGTGPDGGIGHFYWSRRLSSIQFCQSTAISFDSSLESSGPRGKCRVRAAPISLMACSIASV